MRFIVVFTILLLLCISQKESYADEIFSCKQSQSFLSPYYYNAPDLMNSSLNTREDPFIDKQGKTQNLIVPNSLSGEGLIKEMDKMSNTFFWHDEKELRYLERGSQVKLITPKDFTSEQWAQDIFEYQKQNKHSEEAVSVEVLKQNPLYASFRRETTRQIRFAKNGDKGLIPIHTLKRVDTTKQLVVKSDTIFSYIPEGLLLDKESLRAGLVIKPVQLENGAYETFRCCINNDCYNQYYFQIVNIQKLQRQYKDINLKGSFLTLVPACIGEAQVLTDRQYSSIDSLQTFLQTQYSRSSGFHDILSIKFNHFGWAKLPESKFNNSAKKNKSDITLIGPNRDYVHYQGIDSIGSDTWGKVSTICSLVKLTKAFKQLCMDINLSEADMLKRDSRCITQIGDIGFITPARTKIEGNFNWKGSISKERRDAIGHLTHHSGECVDIRPFRKDGNFRATNIKSADYDKKTTKAFIKKAIALGASQIIFSDKDIVDEINALEETTHDIIQYDRTDAHENHIHLCFKEKNPIVANSCASN